jgi:hypothetical protein
MKTSISALITSSLAAALLVACNPPPTPASETKENQAAVAPAGAPDPASIPGQSTAGTTEGAAASAKVPAGQTQDAREDAGASASSARPSSASEPDAALPRVLVHKTESCGCCHLWVEHLRSAGFTVEVNNEVDLNPVKERLGIPYGKGSCHTAEVGGYFVEGHVPAADIRRLLASKPKAKGLVLPGMPLGSPGMEVPDGRTQPYTVELVHPDGATSAFAQH